MEPETATLPVTDWNHILQQLDASGPDYPEAAIRTCQQYPALAIPHLILAIERATERVKAGEPVGMAQSLAIYLLAEFHAREALPAILSAISLPGEQPFELFDDTITEDLGRILAILAEGRPEFVDALVENQALDEYVRGAAIQTYLYWARDGKWSRPQTIERLRHHLRQACERKDEKAVTRLVTLFYDLAARDAEPEVDEAFRLGLVNSEWIEKIDMQDLGEPDDEILGLRSVTAITDTVEETRWWASYDPEVYEWQAYARRAKQHDFLRGSPSTLEPEALTDLVSPGEEWVEDSGGRESAAPGTVRYEGPNVGRNDPCPCGSGKKFKKCCLRPAGA